MSRLVLMLLSSDSGLHTWMEVRLDTQMVVAMLLVRVSSLNNMLGEELMIGSSEGKEGDSNTYQGGFHMSPDMDSMVNKV